MKKMKSIVKNKKGMSAILATLLLVVIVVAMGAIVYAWSTGLVGGMMKQPASTGEALTLDSGVIDSANAATLSLRNVGDSSVSLERCYIKGTDGASATVESANLTDTSVPVSVVKDVTINVNPTAMNFTQGYTYEFKMVTASGNQFVFSLRY